MKENYDIDGNHYGANELEEKKIDFKDFRCIDDSKWLKDVTKAIKVEPILYISPERKYCFQYYDKFGSPLNDSLPGLEQIGRTKRLIDFLGVYSNVLMRYEIDLLVSPFARYYLEVQNCYPLFMMSLDRLNGDDSDNNSDSFSDISNIQPNDLKNRSLIIIDGYSGVNTQKKIAGIIEMLKIKDKCVLINSESENVKKSGILDVINEKNVINDDNVKDRSKELFGKILKEAKEGNEIVDASPSKDRLDEILIMNCLQDKLDKINLGLAQAEMLNVPIKSKKGMKFNKFGKLLNTVKENKGTTLASLFGLVTFEELLRRSFFSGDKTNEKEKAKDLKKLVEQKDTDKYPNGKDKNSAST